MSATDEPWLETAARLTDASGEGVAAVFDSLATTLADALADKRYHVTVDIEERDVR